MFTNPKCGWNNVDMHNYGRCTESTEPCCSNLVNGFCSTDCTTNNIYDYMEPIRIPNCILGEWGVCSNAPVCNGKEENTFGIQKRNYITTNCIIPENQESTEQQCTKQCYPPPEKCGVNNNNNKCSVLNDCCSGDGFCGKGPNFCHDNNQSLYCGNLFEEKDNTGNDSVAYIDHKKYCYTPLPTTTTTITTTSVASTRTKIIPPFDGTTQCGQDINGSFVDSNGEPYGRCQEHGECCSGWSGTKNYGWCGRNYTYCYNQQNDYRSLS